MPTWPAEMPTVRPGGYQEQPQSQILRSDMETGPPKTRRRFTAGIRPVTAQYVVDDAQLQTFEVFFENEIAAGALSFAWTHPRTENQVSAKIVPPYQVEPVNGGLWWLLSLTIEIQP